MSWAGTAISAHFCAAIPNFKVLEVDVDDVPWKDEIVTVVPRIEGSTFYMPTAPVCICLRAWLRACLRAWLAGWLAGWLPG